MQGLAEQVKDIKNYREISNQIYDVLKNNSLTYDQALRMLDCVKALATRARDNTKIR